MNGARVDVAVFTNFTRDHLDYHGSMEAYAAAKQKLFTWPGLRTAIINLDDERGRKLVRETSARTVLGYAIGGGGRRCAPNNWSKRPRASASALSCRMVVPMSKLLCSGATTSPICWRSRRCLHDAGVERRGSRPPPGRTDAAGRTHGASGRHRRTAGGGRLCAYAGCAGECPDHAARCGGGARRTSVRCLRLRRRPRQGQAAANGRGCGPSRRPRAADQRQPAQRGSGSESLPRSERGWRRRNPKWTGPWQFAGPLPGQVPAMSFCWPARGTSPIRKSPVSGRRFPMSSRRARHLICAAIRCARLHDELAALRHHACHRRPSLRR